MNMLMFVIWDVVRECFNNIGYSSPTGKGELVRFVLRLYQKVRSVYINCEILVLYVIFDDSIVYILLL